MHAVHEMHFLGSDFLRFLESMAPTGHTSAQVPQSMHIEFAVGRMGRLTGFRLGIEPEIASGASLPRIESMSVHTKREEDAALDAEEQEAD